MTQDTSAAGPETTGSAHDPEPLATGCPVSGGYDAPPQPLGPDSLTWRYFGQWTGMLQGPWAGSMQNMHPQLGAAVQQHSIFFLERMPRLFRSVYPIGGVVFDGHRAPTTGAQVRDYHIGIKGVDDQGRRYSALNPEVFYWAHATFFKSTLLAAEWLGGGLTEEQKRQLFDEHVQWYRMYGMSMRPVPKSWEDFQQ
ncbi:MAG: oxygenase MpaB family protein, partial [Actinomycetota bacterium]|nr:oxygenase MpaB family protein [Actinomycetota bacterium]